MIPLFIHYFESLGMMHLVYSCVLTSWIGIAKLIKVAFAITIGTTYLIPISRIMSQSFVVSFCVSNDIMNPYLNTHLLAHDSCLKSTILCISLINLNAMARHVCSSCILLEAFVLSALFFPYDRLGR